MRKGAKEMVEKIFRPSAPRHFHPVAPPHSLAETEIDNRQNEPPDAHVGGDERAESDARTHGDGASPAAFLYMITGYPADQDAG